MKKNFLLFVTMLKIGLFTFGGGYAMISLLQNEFIAKKKWMEQEEFMDMVAIAESTPGPIAINAATYIGYQLGKIWGAILCTLGVCIPSLLIIYLISLFFNAFLQITWVAAAFRGIQICVIVLIFSAGFQMLLKLPKTLFNLLVFMGTYCSMILCSVFVVNFSSIFYILLSAAMGLTAYLVGFFKRRSKK